MLNPGDIVLTDFPGAVQMKRRPAVVLSTALYQTHRPDVVVGLLTTQVNKATAPTDYTLLDWSLAGLHQQTAFRSYLLTFVSRGLPLLGHLSDRDWQGVQACLAHALALP